MTLFVVDSQNTLGKSIKEAGNYNVIVLNDSECKKTKETQNDMAVLNYEVVDGKYKGGKILYDNIVWDQSDVELSAKRFNTVLAAIGVADGTPINSIRQLVNGTKGKRLNVTVDWKYSDYSGKWNLVVKGYSKFDEEGSKPNGIERPSEQQMPTTQNINSAQQSSLPGVDPIGDTRSFANGGFNSATISDDDLPF